MKKLISALILGTICLSGCSGNKPFRYGNLYTTTVDNYTCSAICSEEQDERRKQNFGESIITYKITTLDEFNEVKVVNESTANYFYKDGAFMKGLIGVYLVNGYEKNGREFVMFTTNISGYAPVIFEGVKLYAR